MWLKKEKYRKRRDFTDYLMTCIEIQFWNSKLLELPFNYLYCVYSGSKCQTNL